MEPCCPVCCEKFTPVKRKPIPCGFCNYGACMECCQRYLLESPLDADCMSCHTPWNREFLYLHFSKAFVNRDYKAHREQVLFEREKALLPASQHMVENWNRAVYLRERYPAMSKEYYELQAKVEALKRQRADVLTEMRFLEGTNYQRAMRNGADAAEDSDRRSFIRSCPAENCRGFLSSAWKCGTCSVWVCPECHVIKTGGRDDPEHACNPDDVATARLLRRDTKPCPTCAVPITKITGCDQMFCVQCHTAFSWRTGAVVTNGIIHNPHYYEWQRRQNGGVAPRVPGDQPCGGLPSLYVLLDVLREADTNIRRKLEMYHRVVNHVQHVDLAIIRNQEQGDNADLRLRYLTNMIDEKEWKQRLQQREKRRLKNTAVEQILDMFVTLGAEMFRGLINKSETPETVLFRILDLAKYSNENIDVLEKRFAMKIDHIPHV
jgi:hypothetical protein